MCPSIVASVPHSYPKESKAVPGAPKSGQKKSNYIEKRFNWFQKETSSRATFWK